MEQQACIFLRWNDYTFTWILDFERMQVKVALSNSNERKSHKNSQVSK